MITLAAAVLIASFLGSLHCVGMCGPFAVWASQGGFTHLNLGAYHLGRLTTYLSAGLAAGVLGSMVQLGGRVAGLQSLAALLAGGLLIFFGVARLLMLIPWFQPERGQPSRGELKPSQMAALLQRLRPLIGSRGPLARAYLAGLLTTWLPCGWLYLFVLIAAGTGQVGPSLVIMFAFWIGTLPALTALVLGARQLIPRFQSSLPVIASVVLIVTGLYTATGRASADLSSMVAPQLESDLTLGSLHSLRDEPLPCCEF